jgi:hypothetical protein
MFGDHPRHALGRQRVRKSLALHDVERAIGREKIEAKAMRVTSDDPRCAAANFNDIGVRHGCILRTIRNVE